MFSAWPGSSSAIPHLHPPHEPTVGGSTPAIRERAWSSQRGGRRRLDPLASCPPAVQPVGEVRQTERNRGSKSQDVPHIGHQGNPATHQGQRDKHRIPDPKREARLVHSRSIRPNQPSTPPPPYAAPPCQRLPPSTTPLAFRLSWREVAPNGPKKGGSIRADPSFRARHWRACRYGDVGRRWCPKRGRRGPGRPSAGTPRSRRSCGDRHPAVVGTAGYRIAHRWTHR